MDIQTWLGFAAGFLSTLAFVPQVTKIWKTKSARDVSLPAFVVFTIGITTWIAYGIMLREMPIVFWNSVTLVLALAIVAMKLRFG